jgi:hypothetical protein
LRSCALVAAPAVVAAPRTPCMSEGHAADRPLGAFLADLPAQDRAAIEQHLAMVSHYTQLATVALQASVPDELVSVRRVAAYLGAARQHLAALEGLLQLEEQAPPPSPPRPWWRRWLARLAWWRR